MPAAWQRDGSWLLVDAWRLEIGKAWSLARPRQVGRLSVVMVYRDGWVEIHYRRNGTHTTQSDDQHKQGKHIVHSGSPLREKEEIIQSLCRHSCPAVKPSAW